LSGFCGSFVLWDCQLNQWMMHRKALVQKEKKEIGKWGYAVRKLCIEGRQKQ
jgi:hypothetical protein